MSRIIIVSTIAVLAGWSVLQVEFPTVHAQAPPAFRPLLDDPSLDDLESKPLFLYDRELAMRLSRATRAIDGEDYSTAVTHLQTILNNSEDYFVDVGEQHKPEYRSLKQEAQRLLVELPEAGRRSYELQFGIEAQRKLDEAVRNGDLRGMENVARRFFHTKAGYEATYRMGTNLLNRSQPLSAALNFERLREIPTASKALEPMLSLKSAVCWGRAGLPERSIKTLLEFKKRLGRDHVVLGGQRIRLFEHDEEALSWLVDVLGEQPEFASLAEEDWTMFRGNPTRNGVASESSPVWDSVWQHPTVTLADADQESSLETLSDNERQAAQALSALLEDDEQTRRSNNAAVAPAGHPLVLGDTVVVRTLKNLQAVDLRTGQFLWRSIVDDDMYERLTHPGNRVPQTGGDPMQARMQSPVKMFLLQRTWRDLTTGTLSSDGRRIFAIEESGFVGPSYFIAGRGAPHPLAPKEANKLMAYESDGRLLWEVGGSRGDVELDLAGTFFLGPPLPLDQHVYCIGEIGGEIRLLAIDPDGRGRLIWSQSLILPEYPLMQHPFRRMAGLSPSYADGIIVCPTVSGAVIAVDLSRQMLLWAYRYDDNMPKMPHDRRARIQFQMQMRNQVAGANETDEERWLDSNPRIADQHVVVTPQDSDELHCLNIVDGSLIWKKPRGEGLYVAAVYDGKVIVVERTGVRAYRLEDGAPAWREPTPIPIPSGRGVRFADRYLIPLTTAEVATIDLQTGRVLARSKSRDGQIPGNLVSADGVLLSQTAQHVSGFQGLDALKQQYENDLQADPGDAAALALRGEMLLHQGREEEGLADLRRAVELAGDPRARATLVETLMDGLRLDFDRYSEAARELETLIDDPQQRTSYLRLYAAGLQRTGKRREAFTTYLKLAGPDTGEAGMEQLKGTLSVRSDRWVRSRIAELYAESSREEWAEMEEALEAQLDLAIRSDRIEPLRKFLDYFETQPIAEKARWALVHSFDPRTRTLELDRHLQRLSASDDEEVAAYATARRAALLIECDRARDARELIDRLAARWRDTPCFDNKTGGELAAKWRAENSLKPLLEQERPWPAHVVVEEANSGKMLAQAAPLEIVGPQTGPFAGWSLEIDPPRQNLVARDPRGNPGWHLPLEDRAGQQGNYARIHGHVVVLVLGNKFLVLDALNQSDPPQVLWSRNLYESASGRSAGSGTPIRRVIVPGRGVRFELRDPSGRPMGTIGAVTDDFICYQVGTQLFAADTLTGDVLWERRSVARGSEISGDGEFIFVLPPGSNQVSVLRADDGRQVAATRVPSAAERLTFHGRDLALQGRNLLALSSQANRQVLSCIDVATGVVVWSREYSDQAKTSQIPYEGVAVMQPDGQFEIIGLDDGEPVLQTEVQPEPELNNILVLRNQDRYILLANKPYQTEEIIQVQGTGYSNPVINAMVYGFDCARGRRLWDVEISNQAFEMHQPSDLPVLVFASQVVERSPDGRRRSPNANRFSVLILDTRTGEILHNKRQRDPLRGLEVIGRRDKATIDISSARTRFTLKYSDTPADESSQDDVEQSKSKTEGEQRS